MATHAAPSAPRGVTSTGAAGQVCKVGFRSKLGIKPSQTPLYYGSYHGFTILIWQLEHICSTVVFPKTFACGAALFKSDLKHPIFRSLLSSVASAERSYTKNTSEMVFSACKPKFANSYQSDNTQLCDRIFSLGVRAIPTHITKTRGHNSELLVCLKILLISMRRKARSTLFSLESPISPINEYFSASSYISHIF